MIRRTTTYRAVGKRFVRTLALLVVFFGAAAGYQAWREGQQGQEANKAAQSKLDQYHVQDCFTLDLGRAAGVEDKLIPVDCAGSDLSFTVGLKTLGEDECPSPNYFTYRVLVNGKQYGKLCLVPNLREGECYVKEQTSGLLTPVTCSTSAAQAQLNGDARVTKAVLGPNDPASCPDSTPLAFPEPRRLYCLGSPVS